jgi:hypothetical protein
MFDFDAGSFQIAVGKQGQPGSSNGLICAPWGLVCHPSNGCVYFCGGGNAVRCRSADNVVSTIAGEDGTEGVCSRSRIPGGDARFSNFAMGISVSPHGDSLLVSDRESHTVVRVHLDSKETVIVCGVPGSKGSVDGHVNSATFDLPSIALEHPDGSIFVLSASANIRRVGTDGQVRLWAGQLDQHGYKDGLGHQAVLTILSVWP